MTAGRRPLLLALVPGAAVALALLGFYLATTVVGSAPSLQVVSEEDWSAALSITRINYRRRS